MRFKLTSTMSELIRALRLEGHKVFVVGGAVRDHHMHKKPKDLDLATDAVPQAVLSLVERHRMIAIPDAKAFAHGIVRVVDKTTGEFIDLATLRRDIACDGRHADVEFTDSVLEDLSRRDLTINAMAAEIQEDGTCGEVIDPFSGRSDLEDKVIKFVGEPFSRITEDFLRMVRACRFSALGEDWSIDVESFEAICTLSHFIEEVSKERIRDEIMKAIMSPKPSNFFRNLVACGLCDYILPDLVLGIGCDQNEYHGRDKFKCKRCGAILLRNEYEELKAKNTSHC